MQVPGERLFLFEDSDSHHAEITIGLQFDIASAMAGTALALDAQTRPNNSLLVSSRQCLLLFL